MSTAKIFSVRSILLAACVLPASAAIAQPAGVTVTDLGNRSSEPFFSSFTNLTLTTATPVAWYKIRLPRIADPHRFLDISTSGAGFGDTEIGLYSSTGTLIATDDDDGAQNYSALSFGIINPGAATRFPPVAAVGQTAGEPNNGRDGTLSGDPLVGPLGTAADYYIAVTRFNAAFGNNFGVIPPSGPVNDFPLLMTIRMNTPGGQVAPTVNGTNEIEPLGQPDLFAEAGASNNTVAVDVRSPAAGAPLPQSLSFSGNTELWEGFLFFSAPLSQIGTFPLVFRAFNAIGDVTVDTKTLTVTPRGPNCGDASDQSIPTVAGTTIYTYTTTLGNVDGPWTNACFSFTPTGNDVWFRFIPTQSGTVSLSTCNSDTGAVGAQPDTLLGFRGQCFAANPFLFCGDDVGGCGVGTRLSNIPVTAGQEYNIAVRAWSGDIVAGRLAVTFVTGCDSIDFNGDGLFPDDTDLIDFLRVLAGGTCSTGTCSDIDFNNDGLFPDDADLVAFLTVLAGGSC